MGIVSDMFKRTCGDTDPHPAHQYIKIWTKAELPHLRDPELYPDTWPSGYKCDGITIEAWEVVYLHDNCARCEACAENAVAAANESGTTGATWKEMIPVVHPAGTFAEVGHQATVSKV